MAAGAPEYAGSSGRDTTGLADAWGTRGGNFIRRILDSVIPVTVIERFYGELDGSLFGLTAGNTHLIAQRPAVEFVSDFRDWELHQINVWYPIQGTNGGTGGPSEYRVTTTLFTAVSGYNPIEFIPVGPFGPQLVTNSNFDQGTVRGFGGNNPVNNPNGFGYVLADETTRVGVKGSATVFQASDSLGRAYLDSGGVDQPIAVDKKMVNSFWFQRPLRVRRGRRITIQLQMLNATASYAPGFPLQCSILYTELENPRSSYRTP